MKKLKKATKSKDEALNSFEKDKAYIVYEFESEEALNEEIEENKRQLEDEALNKDKVISFRVDSKSFKELQRIAKELQAGTAHAFVREMAQRLVNSAGAVDSWSVNDDKTE